MTPETEAEWIEAARGKTVNQVQQMIAGHRKGDGPDDPTDPDLRRRRMVVEVTPKTVGMYRQAQANIEARLGHRVEDEDQLWQIVLEPHLEAGSEPGASVAAQIWIIKCSECKRAWQDAGGVHAELSPEDLACAEDGSGRRSRRRRRRSWPATATGVRCRDAARRETSISITSSTSRMVAAMTTGTWCRRVGRTTGCIITGSC
jgi:hypothetical protein